MNLDQNDCLESRMLIFNMDNAGSKVYIGGSNKGTGGFRPPLKNHKWI